MGFVAYYPLMARRFSSARCRGPSAVSLLRTQALAYTVFFILLFTLGFADKGRAEDLPPPPTVTSISPNTGPSSGGTNVTITGSNFFAGATTVNFGVNSVAAIFVNGPTRHHDFTGWDWDR